VNKQEFSISSWRSNHGSVDFFTELCVDFAALISIGQTGRTFHLRLTYSFERITSLSILSTFICGNKLNTYRT